MEREREGGSKKKRRKKERKNVEKQTDREWMIWSIEERRGEGRTVWK